MKFHVKFLFVIIASVLCFENAEARPCPQGCFCPNNGKYIDYDDPEAGGGFVTVPTAIAKSLCGKTSASRVTDGDYINYISRKLIGGAVLDEVYAVKQNANYSIYYGVKDGALYWDLEEDVFVCPQLYPSSAAGASSVFNCYKIVNGQKEYYKAPTNTQTSSSGYMNQNGNVFNGNRNYNIDVGTVNALVKDLQSALSKAQALQEVLSKSNQVNSTQSAVSSKTDIDAMKAMISAGITDNKVISDKQIKKVRK